MSGYLPDSLIIEILYRLPVESLVRFRCVCKRWCCLISSPHFINTHLSHSLSATSLLHIRHYSTPPGYHDYYTVYFDPPSKTGNLTLVKKLEVPFKRKQFKAVGFCNGLFCLFDDYLDTTIVLWNPAIRKSLSIPTPHFRFASNDSGMFCHGFGVDPKTHDFKVVRVAYLRETYSASAVEVYSLTTGLWKTLNSIDIHRRILQNITCSTNICLNGTIYWVSYVTNEDEVFSNSMLLFNLTNDTFSEMDLPRQLVHVSPIDLLVNSYGEQISVIWFDHDTPCSRCIAWVINRYGEPGSWTEIFVVVLESEILGALGFRGNGEFLLRRFRERNLLLYDPKSKEFKDVDIHGGRNPFWSSKYVESLVLLDGSSGAIADPSKDASDFDEPTGVQT